MKKINVRFERGESTDGIDVVVRAAKQDEEVTALMEKIAGGPPDMLTVTGEDGSLLRIVCGQIISVSISGKHARVVTEHESFSVRASLQSLEERLGEGSFVRISRHELVNLDKVHKFDFTLNGTLRLELAGGMETWASRRNIPQIRKKLTERG